MSGFRKVTLKRGRPRIGFKHGWYHYLTVDGETAFLLGNGCETCHFFFERYEAGNARSLLTADDMSTRLEEGVGLLEDDLIHSLGRILPSGDYVVWNGPVQPRLAVPGGANDYFQHEVVKVWDDWRDEGIYDPKTPYYRGRSQAMDRERLLFEFLIPLQDPSTLDQDRIAHYEVRIAAGQMPTAFAVSIIGLSFSIDYEAGHGRLEHWTIAHYLLDGHHKVAAAERTGSACGLLSFASVKHSFVTPEAVMEAMAYREGP
jgi:hypothetical protein